MKQIKETRQLYQANATVSEVLQLAMYYYFKFINDSKY